MSVSATATLETDTLDARTLRELSPAHRGRQRRRPPATTLEPGCAPLPESAAIIDRQADTGERAARSNSPVEARQVVNEHAYRTAKDRQQAEAEAERDLAHTGDVALSYRSGTWQWRARMIRESRLAAEGRAPWYTGPIPRHDDADTAAATTATVPGVTG